MSKAGFVFHFPRPTAENQSMQDSLIKELAAIVGPDQFLTTPEERWGYAYDATDRAAMPDLVVFPGSAAEVAAIVRLANEHRFPVTPRGAGTGRSGGSVPIAGGVVLVLTRLNRILEISRPDLVAVVEPGVVLARLKAAVEAQGLYYPRTRPAPIFAPSAATSPSTPGPRWRCSTESLEIMSWGWK